MFKHFLIVLALISPAISRAGEWLNVDQSAPIEYKLTSGFISNHFGNNGKYNNSNTGLGVEIGRSTECCSIVFGEYVNSFSRDSQYVGVASRPWSWELGGGIVSAGMIAGVVTGYRTKTVIAYSPLVLPVITYTVPSSRIMFNGMAGGQFGIKSAGVNFLFAPPIANIDAVASIQFFVGF